MTHKKRYPTFEVPHHPNHAAERIVIFKLNEDIQSMSLM